MMKNKIYTLVLSGVMAAGVAVAQNGEEAKFKKWAATPPMGWNSWDCFGPTVVESEVKQNADYMAAKLLPYGWEYVVVDIRWYVENDKAGGYNQTDPIYVYDEYGRYTPAVNRFPSAANNKGFKDLADYVHEKGLKFGIHIMRGLPKEAVAKKLPVKGTNGITCDMIANNDSACTWLRDNYKVDITKQGAQEYYNSIVDMYAEWGVDFIKVDDLSRPYHHGEIAMLRHAIDQCGRPIVLSMSPGETPLSEYDHASNHANMWRTVDDFWDNWEQLQYQFHVCEKWAPYIAPGTWPDADMLPMGKISIRGERGAERYTQFTRDEQYTLMSLWTIFKSPLMFGGHLPENDAFTDSLLTNKEILYMHSHSVDNKQLSKDENKIIWSATDPANGDKFAALFNLGDDGFVNTKNALYRSGTISYLTTDYSTEVNVDIPQGSKQLCLVVTDGGDGTSYDHADWINPVLVMADGTEQSLTDYDYLKASVGWGSLGVNKNIEGGKLSVNGVEYDKGFAVHAKSVILFEIPETVVQFKALAGLDNTGISQGGNSTVEFMVFNEDPTVREGIDVAKAKANSGLVSRTYQKEGVNLSANVTDAEYLYLVVTDAGDNYNYDHGNWINPVLIDNNGKETLLTSLDWESATSGWDVVKKNKNVDGGALVVNGTSYDNGLGVNANSIIKYKLPTGHNYKTFNTFCGYDSDMDSAPNGVTIEFMVFTEDPAPNNSEAVTLDLRSFGYEEGQECNIRDMWKGIDLGIFINDQFAPEIKEHGSGVYRITPVTRKESSTINISTDKSVYDANDTIEVNISTSGKGDGWIQIIINDEIAGAFAPEESGSAKYYGSGFYKGDYKIRANYSGTTLIDCSESNEIKISVEGESQEDLSILLQRVNSLLTEAEAIDQELIAGIFRSSLNDAIVEGKSINGNSSKTEINAAILILSDNISAAKNSMTIMNELFEIIEEVENFSENIKDGEEKELLTEIISEAIETYRSDDSTSDDIVSMTSELKSAFERCKLTAQPADGKYFDYTSLIVNPSFETGNYDGWVLDNNTSGWFDARTWSDRPSDDGNLFLSIAAGEITSLNLYQDIKNLPLGEYIVTAALRNTGGTEFLTDQHIYAKINEDEPISSDTLKTVSGDNNNNWTTLSAKFFITSDKDNARIGAFSTGDGQKGWFQTDNFRLQYYGRTAAGIATDKEGNSFIIFHNPHGIDIKTDNEITVNIFNINGSICKTVNLSAGYNHIPLSKGVYVINGEKIVL